VIFCSAHQLHTSSSLVSKYTANVFATPRPISPHTSQSGLLRPRSGYRRPPSAEDHFLQSESEFIPINAVCEKNKILPNALEFNRSPHVIVEPYEEFAQRSNSTKYHQSTYHVQSKSPSDTFHIDIGKKEDTLKLGTFKSGDNVLEDSLDDIDAVLQAFLTKPR